MFSPAIAAALRDLGHDVIAVAENAAFPRSRKNPGPLIQALDAWLRNGLPEHPLTEDWLLSP
jgi:hypothetical protein